MLKPLAAALTLLATHALADLSFCNETSATVSIAIGYKDGDSWTSEGWWNPGPGDCVTPAPGSLQNRYYYYRIQSDVDDFPSENYTFCTASKAFTIVGDENCETRGYQTDTFTELDTGEARAWTVSITASGSAPRPDPTPSGTDGHDAVYSALQGEWEDATDDAIGMRIDGDRLIDYFAGIAGGGANWVVAETCAGANGAGPVLLVSYDDFAGEALCWVLLDLTSTRLTFRAIGGTADVTMIKR